MVLKNRVYFAGLLLLLAGLLTLVFAPLLVSGGLRLWIWWQTRSEKIRVEISKIEAPLFHPVILRDVRVHTTEGAALRFDASARRVVVSLNLKSTLLRTRGRAIASISVDNLRAEMHRNDRGTAISENGWNTLQRLLPDEFNLDHFDLRVEDGASVILVRGVSINGSQIEAGRFHAGEVVIVSPLFRQTFAELRGGTNWQDNRLTIAG
ncbi:MAG: hypothetical protein JWO95_282, partial [Verrucomicrobiales bacterium]|nr:hypothetical protein [Verrucomicrobiales bacterium]